MDSLAKNSTYPFADDVKTSLNVNVPFIVNQALQQGVLSSQASFCVMTTHYKLNLKPLTKGLKSYLSQYASSYLEF